MAAEKAYIGRSQGAELLSHRNRKDRIHVLTLDEVLSADVQERLAEEPRLAGCEIVAPHLLPGGPKVETIEALAAQTVSSRVLILDVRSLTLPRIQHAFNKVVGYNRKDLNEIVFTVLIGDGPLTLFESDAGVEAFGAVLARHRVDYSPAAFFYDPFLHYAYAERQALNWANPNEPPRQIPERLAYKFKGESIDVAVVRQYFRAADAPPAKRAAARRERTERLVRFFRKRIADAFAQDPAEAESWLGPEGRKMEGESLRLHLYPLHFEDWVCRLLERSKSG